MSEHGTVSRYNNERCRCERCRTAFREYMRAYRARNPEYVARNLATSAAHYRALMRLRDSHPEEFATLYAAEKAS